MNHKSLLRFSLSTNKHLVSSARYGSPRNRWQWVLNKFPLYKINQNFLKQTFKNFLEQKLKFYLFTLEIRK